MVDAQNPGKAFLVTTMWRGDLAEADDVAAEDEREKGRRRGAAADANEADLARLCRRSRFSNNATRLCHNRADVKSVEAERGRGPGKEEGPRCHEWSVIRFPLTY